MQDQMQEQLAKLQQEMRDQMLEAQKNMMAQMAQLLNGVMDKRKGLMTNTGEDNEDFPPGFTPSHAQTQPDVWYNQLSRARISSWRDLAQAFMKQYNHVTDMAPDRITLQNMEKSNESFRQYAQRWREIAMQVQPPLLEKETTMLFINTLKAPFITHMIGSTTKSFADIVMAGEMIENAIRGDKIEAGKLLKENCTAFKKVVERLIKMGIVKFDDTPSAENPLPNHRDKGINVIGENIVRRIKEDIAEVKTLLRMIWREMVRRGLILSDFVEGCEGVRDYCEFHKVEGHKIQECVEFRVLVQSLIDNKELEFYEKDSEGGNIYTTEGELTKQKVNYPRIIISRPRSMEGGTQVAPKVVIQKPISFPYKDNKMVPWNYDCNVTIPGRENLARTSKEVQSEGSYTRCGRRYDLVNVKTVPVKAKILVVEREKGAEALINEPVKEEEAKEF
ncbi:hypothetical protein EPI10_031654 [Gossypium australe]|uniref:Retrotransposon gag domain-containing protein n=1 Tax=Gossypium australe TaxID=47621 RepID=A0A5B6X4C8_9ROSI|nr:hypothetical protein EPI10_031654 [Gossypium australe]